MNTGVVKFFNAASTNTKGKGYGFITDDDSGKDVFVHHDALNGLVIKKDDKVSYDTKDTPKGLSAINVKKL